MRKWECLVVGFVMVGCSLAWAATGAPPGDFRGITWGGPVTDAILKSEAAGGGTVEVYRNRTKELKPYLGVPVADEAYYFARGKLTGGQLFCRGEENFAKLKDLLAKLYGPPENPKPEFYAWQWNDTQTILTIAYNKKYQYTTVSMTSGTVSPSSTTAKKKVGR
jgi:hypothetical protein